MNKSQMIKKLLIGSLAVLFSASVWAHGGAKGTDTDQCKFELEKDHWIHYTALSAECISGGRVLRQYPARK